MKLRFRDRFVLISLFFVALGVRMWGLTARPLWYDEAFDYWSAAAPLNEIPLAVLETAGSPPLYPYILHYVLYFGHQVGVLRLPSVIFSLSGWFGIVYFSYRKFGFRSAAISGALLAVLPIDVRYAQEAGEYALLTALLTWMVIISIEALDNLKWRYWIGGTILGVLAVYTHYGAIVVVLGMMLAGASEVFRKKKAQVDKLILCFLLGVILCLPLLYFFPSHFMRRSMAENQPPFSLFSDITKFLLSPGETFAFFFTGYPFTRIPTFLVFGFVYLVVGSILWLVWRDRREVTQRLMSLFGLSYIVYYLLVRLGFYALGGLGFRYAIVFIPFLALSSGHAISQVLMDIENHFRWKSLQWILIHGLLLLALLGVCVYSLPNQKISERTRGDMPWPEWQDLPKAMRFWMKSRGMETPTYLYYGAVPAFRYYFRLMGGEDKVQLPGDWVTRCFWEEDDFCVEDKLYYGQWIRHLSPAEKILSIRETLGGTPKKWWLIFSHIYPGEDEEILQLLLVDYRIVRYQAWKGASVYLLVKK